jgi:cytochrome c oxidase assembly factor CtaG/putative copper export protein
VTDPAIESARTAVMPPDRDRPRRADRTIIRWASLSAAVSLLILIAVLVVGDGAYEPSPAGLPDPGPVVGWGLPVIRLLADAAGIATVGFILAGAVLLPSRNGELWGLQLRSLRWAAVLAAAWTALILAETLFTAADIIGEPLHSTISGSGLRSFLTQTSFGTSLLVQAVLAATVALCVPWVLSPRVGLLALALALGAFVPQALTGHAAGAGSHDLAIASLLVHVLGVALWIGGLGALCWAATHGSKALPYAVPRYSTLAGWCFAAVGISGVANAAVRLGSLDNLFGTSYGTLVVAKAVALGILGAFGWRHRRSTVGRFAALRDGARGASTGWPPEDGHDAKAARPERVRRGFLRLASAELTVMLATVALAVGLSRSPTPVTESAAATPAADLIGFPLPPEPTLARYLFSFTPSGFMLALVGLAGALYATGVLSLRRRGVRWPVGRTIAWYGGLAIVLYATCGGLGLYAHVLFSAHMTAHMALSMVAPIPLVLGAPLTLAIRTLPGPRVPGDLSPRQVLLRILHSRPVAALSHPVVAVALFIGSLYGFYFTGLFAGLMGSHLGHIAMEVHFLAVGLLFFWVLVGVDPQPRRVQPLLKIVVLFAAMALHAFFAIALLSSTTPFGESYWAALDRPYSTDLVADQVRGAQISWVLDELPILLVLAAVFRQWVRADEREARRVDRRLDREDRTAAAGGPADGELAAYNAYLAQLDELSRTERAGRHRADIARAERDKTRAERG